MIFKRGKVAEWLADKKIITNASEGLDVLVDHMIYILKQLKSHKLLVPISFENEFEESFTIHDKEKIYDASYWQPYLDKKPIFFGFQGETVIYDKEEACTYTHAIETRFWLDVNKNDCVMVFVIVIQADDFAPNYMINNVDMNPNYEKNHGRLNAFLKDLVFQGYDVNGTQDNDLLAEVSGLEILNYINDGTDLVMFNEYAQIKDFIYLEEFEAYNEVQLKLKNP